MVVQRQLGQTQHALANGHGLGGKEIHNTGLGIELLEAGVAVDDTVPEARGVREQITNGDLALGGLAGPGAIGLVIGLKHLRLLELRDPVRHRIIEPEPPLLPEHHDRGRGDGLGLRCDAENVVALERPAGLIVGHAEGLVVHHLAIAGHQRHRARNTPLANGLLANSIDPGQSLRRHPRFLRRHLAQGRRLPHRSRLSHRGRPVHRHRRQGQAQNHRTATGGERIKNRDRFHDRFRGKQVRRIHR